SASLTSSGSGFSLLLRFATVICAPVADSFLPNDRLHKNFYTLDDLAQTGRGRWICVQEACSRRSLEVRPAFLLR
ncbi:hypothetical protein, partial [Paraburkholderia podalyriae]|uniref:hypothetical protein n=1 Tax=Paraburkholderia podalyriae TaxID=1938811 RepID=UPI001CA45233